MVVDYGGFICSYGRSFGKKRQLGCRMKGPGDVSLDIMVSVAITTNWDVKANKLGSVKGLAGTW